MKGLLLISLVLVSAYALTVEARTSVYPGDESPTACTMQYDPVCGAKEVQCVRAPCYPQYQTYGNACTMGVDGATFVHEGECTGSESGPVKTKPYVPPAHCVAWFDGCNQCGRGENGESYCTLMACEGDPAPGYCTKYDSTPSRVEPAPPTPAPEAPVATSSPTPAVEAEVSQSFLSSLWDRVLTFFRNLF